jgi:hypothetical protein
MTEREKELLGTIEGLVNWISALRELVDNTDCNPDNIEDFSEVLLASDLQRISGENILEKYGFRK